MMGWRLSAIANSLGVSPADQNPVIDGVSIDSRTLQPGDVFVAIPGARQDGHDCVGDAQTRGARALIVQRRLPVDLPQLIVADPLTAVVQLATAWRQQWPEALPVVAVVGSNGKTSTREMIASILRQAGRTPLVTRGNQNNLLGASLTLLHWRETHNVAVLELGANHPGEIRALARLVRPTHAVFTNAGHDHEAGFGGPPGAARANAELLEHLSAQSVVAACRDDEGWPIWRAAVDTPLNWRPCSLKQPLPNGVSGVWQATATGGLLRIQCPPATFTLHVPGQHAGMNALLALAITEALGVDVGDQQAGLASFEGVSGRLQRFPLAGGRWLINDAYNANPSSLMAALQVLAACPSPRVLVLGDMAELGETTTDWHRWAGITARSHDIDALWSVGQQNHYTLAGFGAGGRAFSDTHALLAALNTELAPGATVLLKGSHGADLMAVAEALRVALSPPPPRRTSHSRPPR